MIQDVHGQTHHNRESAVPEAQAAEQRNLPGEPSAPLAIYVHLPFCLKKCPYCDFASGPVSEALRSRYLHSLRQELRTTAWKRQPVRTVFFGGGTPSELRMSELSGLVGCLKDAFDLSGVQETTIECNPGTVDPEKLNLFLELGFNRLSLGVQSFRNEHLKTLGRVHDSDEARLAYRQARSAGFDNISLDLIFAIPGQSTDDWRKDLQEAFSLQPEHLSTYNLTIEAGTEFGRRAVRGDLVETEEEAAAEMFELAMDLSASAGYQQYEISNFARPGRECRHNLVYWQNQPYLGFGVSAASYVDGERWRNTRDLSTYAARVQAGAPPIAESEKLSPERAFGEALMLALRTGEGADVRELQSVYRVDPEPLCSANIRKLRANNLLEESVGRIRLTRQGRLLADYVCAQFLQEDSLSDCQREDSLPGCP